MPTFSSTVLRRLADQVLVAAGVQPVDAAIVADELVQANLAGHDSHGVIRLIQYVRMIRDGVVDPRAVIETVADGPALAVLDGRGGLGQVIATRALELAMTRAGRTGVASVTARGCNHVGRLGSYVLRAAQHGFIALLLVNSPAGRRVAPWGGIDGRLGTNPLAIGAPTAAAPLVLDMTTSIVAEGKLRVLLHRGAPAPPGWLIDAEGRPTTDVRTLYADPPGALLPLGGAVGYKGFGLSLMIDVLGGALSGTGCLADPGAVGRNGLLLTLWKIDRFVPEDLYFRSVQALIDFVRSSRLAPGVDAILLPGEIEARCTAERLATGIPIVDETWRQIQGLAQALGVKLSGPG